MFFVFLKRHKFFKYLRKVRFWNLLFMTWSIIVYLYHNFTIVISSRRYRDTHAYLEFNIFVVFRIRRIESTSTHCLNLFKKAINQLSEREIAAVCEKDCNEFRFLQFYICKYMCTSEYQKCRAAEESYDFDVY